MILLLNNLGENNQLDLKNLTLKATALSALTTQQKVQTMSSLSRKHSLKNGISITIYSAYSTRHAFASKKFTQDS